MLAITNDNGEAAHKNLPQRMLHFTRSRHRDCGCEILPPVRAAGRPHGPARYKGEGQASPSRTVRGAKVLRSSAERS